MKEQREGINFCIETQNGLTVKMHQCDYRREDLFAISAVGDPRDKYFTRVTKVENELLESQPLFSMVELKKHIEKNRLKECAEYFNLYVDCLSDYIYSEYKILKLKKEKGRKRKDWIIEFYFVHEKKDDRGEVLSFYNMILMLPDGQILIDSSNTPRIKKFIDYSSTLIFYPRNKVVERNR